MKNNELLSQILKRTNDLIVSDEYKKAYSIGNFVSDGTHDVFTKNNELPRLCGSSLFLVNTSCVPSLTYLS